MLTKIRKKYHLVMLPTKNQRGLGILNLELVNEVLLAKWFWKLETEDGYGKMFCLISM